MSRHNCLKFVHTIDSFKGETIWLSKRPHNHRTSDVSRIFFACVPSLGGHLTVPVLDFDWIHQAHLWYWLSKLDFPPCRKSSETSCCSSRPSCGGPAASVTAIVCTACSFPPTQEGKKDQRNYAGEKLLRLLKQTSQLNWSDWLFTTGLWERGLCVSCFHNW